MAIANETISIRPFVEQDIQDYFEIMSNEDVFEYELTYALNYDQTWHDLNNMMAAYRQEAPSIITWGVEYRAFQKIIGYFNLTYIDPEQRVAMIGFAFNPTFWRKGLAYQTIELFLNYFFSRQGIRVFCATMGENQRTIQLMEKLGFRREGVLRKSLWAKGQLRDEIYFGIMKEEWLIA
jgi:[ribosomal protein S5]-alanine N-acetyltransferase